MATAPAQSDAVLVRRLQQRDRTAWEELYAAYGDRLHGFAYRLAGNEHDAADLVQETFVRALPRLDALDPESVDIGAYLFTTLRNLFYKQVERAKRQQPVDEVPEPREPAAIEDDPERSMLLSRQQEEVRQANGHLAPRQRLILALRELEDKSYAEIGELVGLKENAVAQLVFRARESLRLELRLAQVDPERLPEECRTYLPLLAAHLDGQLKGARLDRMLAHLEDCERCQDALESMREAKRRYRTLLPTLPGMEVLRDTDSALAASGYWGASSATPAGVGVLGVRGRVLAAAAGAAGMLALAGVVLFFVLSGGENEPPARAPQAQIASAPASTPPQQPPPPAATIAAADNEPPTVRITSAPPPRTRQAKATFWFAADEPGVRFRCRLDSGVGRDCANPARFANVEPGRHVFSVRATDPSGNTGPWTKQAWIVAKLAPASPAPAEPPPPPVATPPPPDPPPPAPAPEASQQPPPALAPPASPQQRTTAPKAPPPPSPPSSKASKPKPKPKSKSKPKPRPKPQPPPPPPDTTSPSVTITSRPPETTSGTSASFSFTADEPKVTFECTLDGAPFAPCADPASYDGVGVGQHSFAVRATDSAGNTGQIAGATWTVEPPPDTTAPTVTITAAPPPTSTTTDASIAFVADEPAVTFACSIDGAAPSGCSSPAAYQGLALGGHTFSVQATDAAGNTGDAAAYSWTIVTPLPDLVISSLTATSVTVTNVGAAVAPASVLRVTLIGSFTIPKLDPGASATSTWSVCRDGTLTAVADAGQAVAESDEGNNTASFVNSCGGRGFRTP